MSNEMIERVGSVIENEVCQYGENFQGFLDIIARKVIAAMREPTEEMISAGVVNNDVDFGVSKDCYQAMIDAALKED